MTPVEVTATSNTLAPATPSEAARMVADAARQRLTLMVVGGRTALRYGWPLRQPATALSTAAWCKVIDYPSADMTITVESGIKVHDLQTILKEQGQRLPIDIAEATRATLGGAVATATCGPGRFGHGTFRDYVIGVSAIDGQGRRFSAGGRVVKNVAGYDLCKLLTGSLGTLGIITQLTLKLRPLHESRVIVCTPLSDWPEGQLRLKTLLTSQTRPVAIELLNPKALRQLANESRVALPLDHAMMCVAFEGTQASVTWQTGTLSAEFHATDAIELHDEQAERFWQALIDYQAASDDPVTFQATLPSSSVTALMQTGSDLGFALQAHAGNGIVIGHLPDRCTTAEQAGETLEPMLKLIEKNRGAFTLLSCDDDWKSVLPVIQPFPSSWRLMRGIKDALDPQGILSPGRITWPASNPPSPGDNA